MSWETVIGLEVHVQLSTRTKMFCRCRTTFGDPPNTNVCPTCLGLPGALPVPNAEAIRLATRGAIALGCTVHEASEFARKNYFYPDLPKGYQISQFDRPLATGGRVGFRLARAGPDRGRYHPPPRRGGCRQAHPRPIPRKDGGGPQPGGDAARGDRERAGHPHAGGGRAYLVTLRQILVYAGVSDCSMEQGSLRVDANISIRRPGSPKLGTKTEVKNLNSFANVERALEAERERQIGDARAWRADRPGDAALQCGHRSGARPPVEGREPRLPVLPRSRPAAAGAGAGLDRGEQREALPELPEARRARLELAYGLPAYDARVLTSEVALAEYYESVVGAGVEPKTAANWVMGDVMTTYNETGTFPVESRRAGRPGGAGARRRREPSGGQARLRRARPAPRPTSPRPRPSGSVWCR